MADETFKGEEYSGHAATPHPEHHLAWNHALDDAVAQAAKKMSPGEHKSFRIELVVDVVRTNPGWIDGYKVNLKGNA